MVSNGWAILRGFLVDLDDRYQSIVAFQFEAIQGALGETGFEE
jgi:hypothetical protein